MEELLVPLRMLNELAYCPRLFALEWLGGEWADSADTVRGRTAHRVVDKPGGGALPEPGDDDPTRRVTRSVSLGSERLGLVGRIDVVESQGGACFPVETKKGNAPDLPEGAWEPERVQVAAQVLLLREHNYRCDSGVLWFAGSRRRVEVPVDEVLERRVLELRDQARAIAASGEFPAPLRDSPKCPRCSLVGICLPDEHHHRDGEVRPMLPARDDGVPLYVQMHGGTVGKSAEEIVVKDRSRAVVARARLSDTTRVVVYGNATVTTPLLRALAERDVPVAFHSFGGWYCGSLHPAMGRNVRLRVAQHRVAADTGASLAIARRLVETKIRNQRVLLRRNGRGVPIDVLHRMKELARKALIVGSTEELLGVEGAAAAHYFRHFPSMLKGGLAAGFDWGGRSRRPPRDPINALLSFLYACLARELTQIVHGVGFDPHIGFLHRLRPGRPALALDLMEEFRPVLVDSVVLGLVNNGVLGPEQFVQRSVGTNLTDSGRRRVIEAWERRLDELATHPVYGSRLSYRRILEVQARMLGKVVLGEIDEVRGFRVR